MDLGEKPVFTSNEEMFYGTLEIFKCKRHSFGIGKDNNIFIYGPATGGLLAFLLYSDNGKLPTAKMVPFSESESYGNAIKEQNKYECKKMLEWLGWEIQNS